MSTNAAMPALILVLVVAGALATSPEQKTSVKPVAAGKPTASAKEGAAVKPAAAVAAAAKNSTNAKPASKVVPAAVNKLPGPVSFPFLFPDSTEPVVPKSQFRFSRTCFNFIYAAVSGTGSDISNLTSFVSPLCVGGSKAQCTTWAENLVNAITAKNNEVSDTTLRADERKMKDPDAHEHYSAWCSKLYSAVNNHDDTGFAAVAPEAAKVPAAKTTVPSSKTPASPALRSTLAKQGQVPASTTEKKMHAPASQWHSSRPYVPKHPAKLAAKVTPKKQSLKGASGKNADVDNAKHCACVHRNGEKTCHCVSKQAEQVLSKSTNEALQSTKVLQMRGSP